MAIIVVGGHSRSVGKTSVVAGLIAALSERDWTAVKITQFGHGICSVNGKSCACAVDEHTIAISEERDRSGESDSSRFLVAGARRSLWVRTKQGRLGEAMPALHNRLDGAGDIIIESNSVMKFLKPDLYLAILDGANPDFKASAREYLGLADAIILHRGNSPDAKWKDVSLESLQSKQLFTITPPDYVTPELVAWIREQLDSSSAEPADIKALKI
jgi:hypothetical protein